MDLSSEERKLFVEAGYHIARIMWQNLGDSDPAHQTEMWDRAESVYEHGCGIMRELGVFRSERPGNYRFAMPLEDVRDYLRGVSPGPQYSFDQIVANFLFAAAGYQGDVSDEKEPFEVPGYLQQAMWAFVNLGYATREPKGFMWTDKIAPIMVAAYLWRPDGQSVKTEERQIADDLSERVWAAIPAWRRHLLARWIVGKSEMDLFIYLFRRWDGNTLRLFELPKGNLVLPHGYHATVREIASRLIELRKSHPF